MKNPELSLSKNSIPRLFRGTAPRHQKHIVKHMKKSTPNQKSEQLKGPQLKSEDRTDHSCVSLSPPPSPLTLITQTFFPGHSTPAQLIVYQSVGEGKLSGLGGGRFPSMRRLVLTVRYWGPGQQFGLHTPAGSRSRPADGDMWHARPCRAAHPQPPDQGSALESRWRAAATVGRVGSRTGWRAGWQRREQCGWCGKLFLWEKRTPKSSKVYCCSGGRWCRRSCHLDKQGAAHL